MRFSFSRVWGRLGAAALALCVLALFPLVPAGAGEEEMMPNGSRFGEVGRLRLEPGNPDYNPDRSGWLILDPDFRRGYVIYERSWFTLIRSFDLDTLQYRRTIEVAGVPIATGPGAPGGGNTTSSGEVMHAVDPVAHRLYLPLSTTRNIAVAGDLTSDRKRMVSYVLVVDEVSFDQDPAHALGAFGLPAGRPQLADYPLMGMTVSRHRVAGDEPGRIVAAFASPNPLSNVPLGGTPIPGAFDHTLVQWDPRGVAADGAGPTSAVPATVTPTPLPVAEDWARTLEKCATAPMSSTGASGLLVLKNLQWGILANPDAIYLGCQSAPQSGAVARVELDGKGHPGPVGTGMQVFPLAKPIGDVVVDPGAGGRLFVRSFGGGTTWWVFDARSNRFSGSIAGTANDDTPTGAGVDPGTGRFYLFNPDQCLNGKAIRGGLRMTEGRLDPVPAPENVMPELAFTSSYWRVQTDPVAHRVYVRRSWLGPDHRTRYPDCSQGERQLVPPERVYRVLEDRIPIATQPPDIDDSIFTTNVKESPGITQASYLASGTGYGTRIVATGGAGGCNGDREYLFGSVGEAQISEVSLNANATSFDADKNTQKDQCIGIPTDASNNLDQTGTGLDRQLSTDFDHYNNKTQAKTEDGINDYTAQCLDQTSTPSVPRTDGWRDGFVSSATCNQKTQTSEGTSTASLGLSGAVTVAYSHSTVTVQKDPIQGGVIVKVTSIARDIQIAGVGTIGLVKTEATARAGGRVATANTTFKRTICDIDLGEDEYHGCQDENDQKSLEKDFNERFTGKAAIRFRTPDPKLSKGSYSGYRSAIQRDYKELFQDRVISRDPSLTVPGLELIKIDDNDGGAKRTIFHFAGVQASTSYSIVCLYGQADTGACNTDSFTSAYGDLTDGTGLDDYAPSSYDYEQQPFASAPIDNDPGLLTKIINSIQRFGQRVGEGLLLALSSPMQGALVATVWGLLYLPHYLAARRRLLPSAGS